MRREHFGVGGALALWVLVMAGCASTQDGSGRIVSEGTPHQPVVVEVDQPHQGSVAAGESSYYTVRPTQRTDVYIEVSGLGGEAELEYYGSDGAFADWQTASQGDVLTAEDYFVEPPVALFFAVRGTEGTAYTITVREDPYLDTIGLMINGRIYQEAAELESGMAHGLSMPADGLAYYRVVVQAGPVLRIEAPGLPEYARLVWFDTDGGEYGSAGSSWGEGQVARIDVDGVAAGTACLFYVVAPSALARPEDTYRLVITEGASAP